MRLTTDEIKESVSKIVDGVHVKAYWQGFFVGFITACLLIMVIILIVKV